MKSNVSKQGLQAEMLYGDDSKVGLKEFVTSPRFKEKPISSGHSTTYWLGLTIDHERLFDALQDEWLRPIPPANGLLVAINSYADDKDATEQEYLVRLRIKLNLDKLPKLTVAILRDGIWTQCNLNEIENTDTAMYWPGVLPTFAISQLTVSTREESVRLVGMTRHVSNVELPDVPILVDQDWDDVWNSTLSPPENSYALKTPAEEDSLRGAIAMALWAVPRIDPWLDLLKSCFSNDRSTLSDLAADVAAEWWSIPPWGKWSVEHQPSDDQESLWWAANETFRKRLASESVRPRETAELIAKAAIRRVSATEKDNVNAWLNETRRIYAPKKQFKWTSGRPVLWGRQYSLS